jgi:hypothetical protein
MAKDKITEYDATANNNTVVGDVNLAENSALPSDMNNAIREVMSHQKEAFGSGTPLYVDQTNNRVGILETSPQAPLHITTGANTDIMRFGADARWGFQRANSDSRYLSLSRAMNGTPSAVMVVDGDTGAITKPLQPAFLANATTTANIPINATTTIAFGTEVYDQNADFASNTFTAPVTGKYQFSVQLLVLAVDIDSTYVEVRIKTSNRNYFYTIDPDVFDRDAVYYTFPLSALADMDANDTALVEVQLPNDGVAQMDISAGSTFSGFLAC